MNVYNAEEVERINRLKETNDKLEKYFTDKRENWKKEIEPLFETIKIENISFLRFTISVPNFSNIFTDSLSLAIDLYSNE